MIVRVVLLFSWLVVLTACPLLEKDDEGGSGNGVLASGSFNGLFEGSGSVFAKGSAVPGGAVTIPCERAEIEIETDDETYIHVNRWAYTCNGDVYENLTTRAKIVDGRIISQFTEEDMGTLVNSTISIALDYPDVGVKWRIKASAFEKVLEVEETVTMPEMDAVFNSKLYRQVPESGEACAPGEDCVEIER